MSMVALLRSISPDELNLSLGNPTLLKGLLDWEEGQSSAERFCLLEKTQFAILFLLTGDAWDTYTPLTAAIYGSHEAGLMLPAGPLMYLTPEEVRGVASELSSIKREEMAKRYSPERLTEAGIYPGIWHTDPEALTSVLNDYDTLVAFYTRAADLGEAMLLHIG
jgi:hypothetical protein